MPLAQVWYGEDVYKITEDLKQSYPYAYSAVHGPGCNGIPDEGYSETPPCPLAEFEVLGACMIKRSCTKQQTISWVVGCIFLNCLTELRALPPACLSCFLTTFTDNTFVNVQKRLVKYEPRCEKTGIRGFRHKPGLCSDRRSLEA